ncbi:MAG: haloacid dehalogenase type II [Oxalobacteraceae bacterium]|nr:MAG: haloacid dehalogenase type II [Oxalobacteraceae bacterium]
MSIFSTKPKVLFFDVNETLLDMTGVKARVGNVLSDSKAAELWFTTTLQYSLVMSVSDQYAEFSEIGAATLKMIARKNGIDLSETKAKETLSPMRTLPPHPDVKAALGCLKARGWRMAVLSNSSKSGMKAQMAHAELEHFLERQMSVESVGKFKPHADVYQWATNEMNIDSSECMLVAAHGWDVAGAKWAGWQTAFIGRKGEQTFPLGPKPDIEEANLLDFASSLNKKFTN